MKYNSIIWDWNGTLLDDLSIAVSISNQLLDARNLTPISMETYLDVFTFPVRDYYEQVGFDLKKEHFEIPALQFISSYNKAVETCGLHQNVILALTHFRELGYRQFILSAMEQQLLEKTPD